MGANDVVITADAVITHGEPHPGNVMRGSRGPGGDRRPAHTVTQTTMVIRSAAISSGSVTESNEATLTWLLPNLSWAWFFLAPSW